MITLGFHVATIADDDDGDGKKCQKQFIHSILFFEWKLKNCMCVWLVKIYSIFNIFIGRKT